jgi:hypothetical protein
MAFRFRKYIKLLPGLRLNLSKGGVSLSAGIPGAHINFSPRGARTTFGVPGTGFSWSRSLKPGQLPRQYLSPGQPEGVRPIKTTAELVATVQTPGHKVVYTRSGRKLSRQQLEAGYRLALREWRQEAQAKVDTNESDLAERLNSWRDIPSLPSDADYQGARRIQPFRYEAPEPSLPNYQDARTALEGTISRTVNQEIRPTPKAVSVLIAIVSLVSGVLLGVLGWQAEAGSMSAYALFILALGLALGGLGVSIMIYLTKSRARCKRVSIEVIKRVDEQWPVKEQQLGSGYDADVASYSAERAESERSWQQQEHDRIAWASKLLDGDEATIQEAVCHTLADLDFPFETRAEFAIEDAHTGYLHLDLPELEDIVPRTRYRVLKAGRLKAEKRNESERNAEYSDVACGVGLMMASAVFAAAPTLQDVSIAAYTQRQQKGGAAGLIGDDYVYFVTVPRIAFNDFDATSVDPTLFIEKLSGRLEHKANHVLKKLPEEDLPGWVREFRSQHSQENQNNSLQHSPDSPRAVHDLIAGIKTESAQSTLPTNLPAVDPSVIAQTRDDRRPHSEDPGLYGKSLILATQKPKGWEYLLFAQVIMDGVERAKHGLPQVSEPDKLSASTICSVDDFSDWATARLAEMKLLSSQISELSIASDNAAFGAPGQPGSVPAIVSLARQVGLVCQRCVEWSQDISDAPLHPLFREAAQELHTFTYAVIDSTERFANKFMQQVQDALSKPPGSHVVIDAHLKIDQPDLTRFQDAMRTLEEGKKDYR